MGIGINKFILNIIESRSMGVLYLKVNREKIKVGEKSGKKFFGWEILMR